jgi:hypothetical protein
MRPIRNDGDGMLKGRQNPTALGYRIRRLFDNLPRDVHAGGSVREGEPQFVAFGQPKRVGGSQHDFIAHGGAGIAWPSNPWGVIAA